MLFVYFLYTNLQISEPCTLHPCIPHTCALAPITSLCPCTLVPLHPHTLVPFHPLHLTPLACLYLHTPCVLAQLHPCALTLASSQLLDPCALAPIAHLCPCTLAPFHLCALALLCPWIPTTSQCKKFKQV